MDIKEILNSLFSSSASDASGFLQGPGTAAGKGVQPKGNTFEDVLAQFASSKKASSLPGNSLSLPSGLTSGTPASTAGANGNNPADGGGAVPGAVSGNNGSEKFFLASETTVAITESVQVNNLSELAQAEQSLVSLASSLSQLLGLLSVFQGLDPAQAQNALVASGGGRITPADARALLNDLQALVQKVPDSQNPLLLSLNQQNGFLNQMLQQMLLNQQVLLGPASGPAGSGKDSSGTTGNGVLPHQDVMLQLFFSDSIGGEIQALGAQTSKVAVNLQTFQMEATFIQAGSSDPSGSQGASTAATGSSSVDAFFQPLPVSNAESLFSALNQALGNAGPSTGAGALSEASSNPPASRDGLNRNFRDLVQLLFRSGVGRAVLTTLMSRQNGTVDSVNVNSNSSQTGIPASPLNMDLPIDLPGTLSSTLAMPNPGKVQGIQGLGAGKGSLTQLGVFENSKMADGSTLGQLPASDSLLGNGEGPQSSTTGIQGVNAAAQPPELISGVLSTRGSFVLGTQELNALNDLVVQFNALGVQESPTTSLVPRRDGSLDRALAAIQQIQPADQNSQAPSLPTGTANSGSSVEAAIPGSLLVDSNVLSPGPADSSSGKSPLGSPALGQGFLNGVALSGSSTSGSLSGAALMTPSQDTLQSTPSKQPAAEQPVLVPFAPTLDRASASGPAPTVSGGQAVQPDFGRVSSTGIAQTAGSPSNHAVTLGLSGTTARETQPANDALSAISEGFAVPAPNVSASGNGPIQTVSGMPVVRPDSLPTPPPVPSITPAPTSPAPDVSVSLVTGEVVKTLPSAQVGYPNTNAANVASVTTPANPAGSAVSPLSATAVVALAPGDSVPSNSLTANDLSKNTKDQAVAQLNLGALLTGIDKTAGNPQSVVSNPQGSGFSTNGAVDNAQVLNQITQQVAAQVNSDHAISRLNFQLVPESLGRVTVQIALVDQSVSARIVVSNPDVKNMLQHHMVELKTALNQSGLQIDQLQVQVGGGSSNLLAQYSQYQQEGFGNKLPNSLSYQPLDEPKTPENMGDFAAPSVKLSLVDVLA